MAFLQCWLFMVMLEIKLFFKVPCPTLTTNVGTCTVCWYSRADKQKKCSLFDRNIKLGSTFTLFILDNGAINHIIESSWNLNITQTIAEIINIENVSSKSVLKYSMANVLELCVFKIGWAIQTDAGRCPSSSPGYYVEMHTVRMQGAMHIHSTYYFRLLCLFFIALFRRVTKTTICHILEVFQIVKFCFALV